METLLKDIVEEIVASIIAAPILFVAGFYARPFWDRLAGREAHDSSSSLPAGELVYLITLAAILGGAALFSPFLAEKLFPTPEMVPATRAGVIVGFVIYLFLSSIFHFLGLNILSSWKGVSTLDVSADSATGERNRIFAAVTMAKISVFLLMSGWTLWASPPHLLEPFVFGLFFLLFIDIIGAIVMLLLD